MVQAGHLAGAPSGAFEQLIDEHGHFAGPFTHHAQSPPGCSLEVAGDSPEQVELPVEAGHHVVGQRPSASSSWSALRPASSRRKAKVDGKVGTKAHLPGLADHQRAVLHDGGRPAGAVRPAPVGLERGAADQEPVDVGPPEGGGVVAAARPAGQDRRQRDHGVDLVLDGRSERTPAMAVAAHALVASRSQSWRIPEKSR